MPHPLLDESEGGGEDSGERQDPGVDGGSNARKGGSSQTETSATGTRPVEWGTIYPRSRSPRGAPNGRTLGSCPLVVRLGVRRAVAPVSPAERGGVRRLGTGGARRRAHWDPSASGETGAKDTDMSYTTFDHKSPGCTRHVVGVAVRRLGVSEGLGAVGPQKGREGE